MSLVRTIYQIRILRETPSGQTIVPQSTWTTRPLFKHYYGENGLSKIFSVQVPNPPLSLMEKLLTSPLIWTRFLPTDEWTVVVDWRTIVGRQISHANIFSDINNSVAQSSTTSERRHKVDQCNDRRNGIRRNTRSGGDGPILVIYIVGF